MIPDTPPNERAAGRARRSESGESSPDLDARDRALIELAQLAGLNTQKFAQRAELALERELTAAELYCLCEELNAVALLPPWASEQVVVPQVIRLGDHETAFINVGKGPPLVVLHSLGLDWRVARSLLPKLTGVGRVLAYDLRSHGSNSAGPETFSLERCASDLLEFLDALEIGRAHLAGFSLGGAVAQLAALAAPDRIASLVLVCTMAKAKTELYLERARAAEEHGTTAVQLTPTLRRWFSDAALTQNPWYVRYARERVRTATARQWSQWWRSFSSFDIVDQLTRITCPALVVAGEHDVATTPAEMLQMAESLPNSVFHIVPGGSHMSVLERPSSVAELVTTHLARTWAA